MSVPGKLPNYLAIEGNIGAGKTTLAQKLADDFSARLILEQFTDNPFLPLFYEHPERYGFSVELFFMTERHKQLQQDLAQQDLFQENLVADYFFIKTLLFAKNNLTGEEYRLFQRLFSILNGTFPKPDVLLYLHRPVPQLLRQIEKRGRGMESDISSDYLIGIQKAYFEYFRTERTFPVIILDLEDADFFSDQSTYEAIVQLLRQPHAPGIHHVPLDALLRAGPSRKSNT